MSTLQFATGRPLADRLTRSTAVNRAGHAAPASPSPRLLPPTQDCIAPFTPADPPLGPPCRRMAQRGKRSRATPREGETNFSPAPPPASPARDSTQTPHRGHPRETTQHAAEEYTPERARSVADAPAQARGAQFLANTKQPRGNRARSAATPAPGARMRPHPRVVRTPAEREAHRPLRASGPPGQQPSTCNQNTKTRAPQRPVRRLPPLRSALPTHQTTATSPTLACGESGELLRSGGASGGGGVAVAARILCSPRATPSAEAPPRTHAPPLSAREASGGGGGAGHVGAVGRRCPHGGERVWQPRPQLLCCSAAQSLQVRCQSFNVLWRSVAALTPRAARHQVPDAPPQPSAGPPGRRSAPLLQTRATSGQALEFAHAEAERRGGCRGRMARAGRATLRCVKHSELS